MCLCAVPCSIFPCTFLVHIAEHRACLPLIGISDLFCSSLSSVFCPLSSVFCPLFRGVISDLFYEGVVQLQVMALLAMEQPVSLHPDDIRDGEPQ